MSSLHRPPDVDNQDARTMSVREQKITLGETRSGRRAPTGARVYRADYHCGSIMRLARVEGQPMAGNSPVGSRRQIHLQ
jgi:hypothetical protein